MFSTARDHNATASALSRLMQDMLLFAGEQLRTSQPKPHTGCPVCGSMCDVTRQMDGVFCVVMSYVAPGATSRFPHQQL